VYYTPVSVVQDTAQNAHESRHVGCGL